MKLIYDNFDGLDITFQCVAHPEILELLRNGKEEAQRNRKKVYVNISEHGHSVAVAEAGMRGGFSFQFDTGLDGAVWAIRDSANPEDWGVRVSVKSLALALYGYEGVKKHVFSFLMEVLRPYYEPATDLTTGEILPHPKAHISRFDYCFDFQVNDFNPSPECITTTSNRMKKAMQMHCIERSGKIESIRIGSMPNRQLAIYNKTREIIDKHKPYWWNIWQINKDEFSDKIWRFEVRAGKEELNKWSARPIQVFEEKAGDIILHILSSIRYVTPNDDSNKSRWPNADFWQDIINHTGTKLDRYMSGAAREQIIMGYRKEIVSRIIKNIAGTMTTFASLQERNLNEMQELLKETGAEIIETIKDRPKHYRKKHEDAEKKYKLR